MKRWCFIPLLLCLNLAVCICAAESDLSKAELTRKARGGDIQSQYELGLRYEQGTGGVRKNNKEALKWYEMAGKKNHADALFKLGNYYLNHTKSFDEPDLTPLAHLPSQVYIIMGIPVDTYYNRDQEQVKRNFTNKLNKNRTNLKTALSYYKEAVKTETGHLKAKYILGAIALERELLTDSTQENIESFVHVGCSNKYQYFEDAAKHGDPVAQYFLGICHLLFTPDDQYETGKRIIERLITNEDQRKNFTEYLKNMGFAKEQDLEAANDALLKSAEQGYAPAQHYLGNAYSSGRHFSKRDDAAVKYFRMAAEQGHPDAQYQLGRYYLNGGKNVAKNPQEAIVWFEKAGKQRHADAQYQLALCYTNGIGTEKDLEKAAYWFKKAADHDHIDGEYRYAVCCRDGIGIKENPAQARKYFLRAARGNHSEAQYQTGLCLANGYGGDKNKKEAMTWLYYAGEKKHALAQFALANYFLSGSFDSPDLAGIRKTIAASVKKIEKEYDEYFMLNNNIYTTDTSDYDFSTIFARSIKIRNEEINSLKKGHQGRIIARIAQNGYMYAHGIHDLAVEKSGEFIETLKTSKYALAFYARSAANGCKEAQYIYAVCLTEGVIMDITPEPLKILYPWREEILVEKNPQTAEYYLEKSAVNGLDIARHDFAVYALEKKPEKVKQAVTLLRKVSPEYLPARFLLAKCLASGKGTAVSAAEAEKIFEEVFAKDSKYGLQIAEFYDSLKNVAAAGKWYEKSAAGGEAQAIFKQGMFYAGQKQPEKAKEAFRNAAAGNPVFAVDAAKYYMSKNDLQAAEEFANAAIESNNPDALFALAAVFAALPDKQQKRMEILALAANAGHTEAQYMIAEAILKNNKSEEFSLAISNLSKAAQNNHPPALTLLAKCYVNGTGVEIDLTRAIKLFEKAAEKGSGEACFQLAQCYASGNWNMEKDEKKAVELLYSGAKTGNKDCCRQLANYLIFEKEFDDRDLYIITYKLDLAHKTYLEKSKSQINDAIRRFSNANGNEDVTEAVFSKKEREKLGEPSNENANKYKKLFAEKRKKAMYDVYTLELYNYFEQKAGYVPAVPTVTLESNFKCALSMYTAAGKAGNAYSQYITGLAFFTGFNDIREANREGEVKFYQIPMLKKNYTEAVKYFKMAAEQDNFHAQYHLGLCYLRGLGVKKDPDEALKYLVKAAEKGHIYAQYELGMLFKDRKEYKEAFKFFNLAAIQNEDEENIHDDEEKKAFRDRQVVRANAKYEVAECYGKGLGVEKNQKLMIHWYHQAAYNRHFTALQKLRDLYADGKKIEDKEAARWYRKESEKDYVAQYIYAICLKYGSLEKKSDADAIFWFEKAGFKGILDAQYEAFLGYFQKKQKNADDKDKIIMWLEMASGNGHPMALYYDLINRLFDLKNDFSKIESLDMDLSKIDNQMWENNSKLLDSLRIAAQSGLPQAQYIYGYYLMYRKKYDHNIAASVKLADRIEAADWFYKAAVNKVKNADKEMIKAFARDLISKSDKSKDPNFIYQCLLQLNKANQKAENKHEMEGLLHYAYAQCLVSGYGTKKNLTMAGKYYKSAVDKGYSHAKFRYGCFYAHGEMLKKDLKKAEELFRGIDHDEIPDVKYETGVIYYQFARRKPKKGEDDRREEYSRNAFECFKWCAENGQIDGTAYLGLCYEKGIGVEQNDYLAVENYLIAAKAGHREACYQLGLCYLEGRGVDKNRSEAIRLLKESAAKKFKPAIEKLKELGE